MNKPNPPELEFVSEIKTDNSKCLHCSYLDGKVYALCPTCLLAEIAKGKHHKCVCMCECETMIGAVDIELCSVCCIRDMRGDAEHGLIPPESEESWFDESQRHISTLITENESLKQQIERLESELARRDEPGAVMRDTRGNSYNLMFACQACCRRAIFTNRNDKIMRCPTCSHDEFQIEIYKRDE